MAIIERRGKPDDFNTYGILSVFAGDGDGEFRVIDLA